MRFIAFILFMVLCSSAQASVFVVYNTLSKEVLSVSNQDDAVVPDGYSKEIMVGNFSDYPLEYQAQDYKLINKRFVANTAKISDRESKIQASMEKQEEMDMIHKEAFGTAYEALKSAGYTFKHVKDEDFK